MGTSHLENWGQFLKIVRETKRNGSKEFLKSHSNPNFTKKSSNYCSDLKRLVLLPFLIKCNFMKIKMILQK